jgi:NAD-dependent deacetylase
MNERLKEAIDKAEKIVFLTGAGISVPSGLPQYQGNRDAKEAYNAIREELEEKIRNAEPSLGHLFIARLHEAGKDVHVITQNVDSLHQKAGLPLERVHELHGNRERGDVVEFGMDLPQDVWEQSIDAAYAADLFIVIGTSLQVSPVSLIPEYVLQRSTFKKQNVSIWVINKTPTPLDWQLGPNVIHDDLVNVLGDEDALQL